jgi:hypothetical protein
MESKSDPSRDSLYSRETVITLSTGKKECFSDNNTDSLIRNKSDKYTPISMYSPKSFAIVMGQHFIGFGTEVKIELRLLNTAEAYRELHINCSHNQTNPCKFYSRASYNYQHR